MSAAQRLSQISSHVAGKAPLRVSVIGSGNWGNALAKIVAENTGKKDQTLFSPEVKMWMFEETIQHEGRDQKITEVFNRTHENVKLVQVPMFRCLRADTNSRLDILRVSNAPRTFLPFPI